MILHFYPVMKWSGLIITILFSCLSGSTSILNSAYANTLDAVTRAIVRLDVKIKPKARTAETLGLERTGNGVVIGENGLIMTIGYLIMESSHIRITAFDGSTSVADFLAYDHQTGLGLLRTRQDLGLKPLKLGDSRSLRRGVALVILSAGKSGGITPVRVSSRRPFAGYWEYLLDSAIFTMPPHHKFGGSALVNLDGQLMGIGSLFVGDASGPNSHSPGNMFVPIDLAKPILQQMVNTGRSGKTPRPWLGIYAATSNGRVYISQVAVDGPSAKAGLKAGDIIIGVKGRRVSDLADLFRKVWSQGDAGTEITLNVIPSGSANLGIQEVLVRSQDRYRWLRIDKD